MASEIVSYGALSPPARSLADQLTTSGPEPVWVHLDVPFKVPSAHGVTFQKPGRKPDDATLAELYESAPEGPPGFVIAIRSSAEDPARLVLTLAHELEHVRQELACPRILDLSNVARDFIQERHADFPEYPCELYVPVNAHAEARAIVCAKCLLGESQVRDHYSNRPGMLERLDGVDPTCAAADLAALFRDHWLMFESWYGEAIRPTKPPLDEVRAFVEKVR